jgi:ABC-2 type transport system permease protein
MFIFMFGSMVMRSVIEEKTTRIIEVIVSSVKPFQIMMGKIIGVASVALTQFLIWIVFTMLIVTVAGQALGLNEAAQTMSSVSSEVPVAEITSAMQDDGDGLLQALKDVNYVQIIGCFIIYFVLGYLLYSSMFAAVGAAVDNEADTQQLILPITMPLIVGLFLMLHTFQYPDSALSFWGSVIPFTSPMVMMARIAYGVPMWELALSIGVLVLTFVGMAYLSGRIYRVGILMYGKKPGWKEIWKWLKY